jgi:hypothetical protein
LSPTVQKSPPFPFLMLVLSLLCWVGAHCGIYNSSYLNSSSPSFWNSCNRFHFSIYTHVYTVFAPYSPSHTLSPSPSPLPMVPTPSSRQYLFCPPVLQFVKEKKWHFCLFKIALWHFSLYIYVL